MCVCHVAAAGVTVVDPFGHVSVSSCQESLCMPDYGSSETNGTVLENFWDTVP